MLEDGTLVAWADGLPFAWVDDEITDADWGWVSAHHPGPALLYRVEPSQGITSQDAAALDSWLREVPNNLNGRVWPFQWHRRHGHVDSGQRLTLELSGRCRP